MDKKRLSPFKYSDDNKRYQTYNYYLKHRFGRKVYKVPLNLSLSCPNRDGSKGTGGCKFCSSALSGEFAGDPAQDIKTQYENIRAVMEKKWQGGLCIPYFQSGSNTYTDIGTLEKMLSTAAALENAVGISIATRADCLDEEKCALMGEYAKRMYFVCELGLQTVHDKTAQALDRCHTYADFLKGCEMLRKYGINICVHIIDGLPGEYVNIVADQIELMPETFVIGRITGDGAKSDVVAPLWSLDKFKVMNSIDRELCRRGTWQGYMND